MRYHATVVVHAWHREQRWEPPSASLIERDPEVIPDVDIAVKVGKDLFLDEKIPRHESGQGYVRVVEHSVLWKEKETFKVFTYQGLTTCTEVDKSWTIMSGAYNHVRSKRGKDERSMAMFIRQEVEHQERLEAAGTGHQRGEYCGLYNVYSYWAGGWACTSHPGFWVRFPNERNQGKQGATLC